MKVKKPRFSNLREKIRRKFGKQKNKKTYYSQNIGKVQTFKPFYGWGWFNDKKSVEVPVEFNIEIKTQNENEIFGIILAPHLYEENLVRLSYRHVDKNTNNFNVHITDTEGKPIVTGFAEWIK